MRNPSFVPIVSSKEKNMSALHSESKTMIQSPVQCSCFSLAEIQSATNDFDDDSVIGIGGFSKVYKGFIDDGATTVAIKRLNPESETGGEDFWAEVRTVSELRHPHLVALIGYCNEGEEKVLVYEYMANGTLAHHLHKVCRDGDGDGIGLSWDQRFNICIGVARGLDYLHTGSQQSFIHRDIKTTNILLDDKWVAKISDFGLLKGPTNHSKTHVSTVVKGTFGYFDPHYFMTQRLTKKSDVYAFGVVMLEVLCGRQALDTRLEEEQISLVSWAQKCIKKGKIHHIIDPSLNGEISRHVLKDFAELTIKCLQDSPNDRPKMDEVVGMLELVLTSHNKGRTDGIIAKVIRSMVFAPKLIVHWWKERKGKDLQVLLNSAAKQYRRFSLATIQVATNNFSASLEIELGGVGSVYKGRIDGENLVVAVKRLVSASLEELRATMQAHNQLRHLNIISLIGYCCDKQELILVYDYMGNGSLHDHLHGLSTRNPIPWDMRLQILIDAARGLQYLHGGANTKFIHRDLKSSHILLDENWVAKVSGLERITVLPPEKEYVIDDIVGTYGYVDVECVYGTVGKSSDVFSFGVVLVESLCAKKPVDAQLTKGKRNLVLWLRRCFAENTMDEVIDPYLIGKITPECLREFVRTALNCACLTRDERPSMDDVVDSLRNAMRLQQKGQDRIDTRVVPPMGESPAHNRWSSLEEFLIRVGSEL